MEGGAGEGSLVCSSEPSLVGDRTQGEVMPYCKVDVNVCVMLLQISLIRRQEERVKVVGGRAAAAFRRATMSYAMMCLPKRTSVFNPLLPPRFTSRSLLRRRAARSLQS